MARQTLEQARAQNAWECSKQCSEEYANLAKSLPALIMNSGLMQVMAYLQEKSNGNDSSSHGKIGKDLRNWLHKTADVPSEFDQLMEYLMKIDDSRKYQNITSEAFAWLKWLRQMAPARQKQ